MGQFKIIATAPTSYQLASLRHFGLNVNSYPTGAHVGTLIFDTLQEAKEHLVTRAELYFEDESELQSALIDIENNFLRMDAVTGSIEEFNEN